jgi:hypothetical protein
MKRTLLAVGIAVLVSMMAVPNGVYYSGSGYRIQMWLPFFFDTHWLAWNTSGWRILWSPFILQTVFAAVLLAVIVNLEPRRK